MNAALQQSDAEQAWARVRELEKALDAITQEGTDHERPSLQGAWLRVQKIANEALWGPGKFRPELYAARIRANGRGFYEWRKVAMTTLCPIDFSTSERSNVVPFPARGPLTIDRELARITEQLGCAVSTGTATEKRLAIEGQVRTHCVRLGIGPKDAQRFVDLAVHLWRAWCSPAMCVARANKAADAFARERARPSGDDLPPAA